jgi:Holliday junction resolvase RusA-like endonuclease
MDIKTVEIKRYEYTILGTPVAQGRPRFTKAGHCYDPNKSKAWKNFVALELRRQGAVPMVGALSVSMAFLLPKPKGAKRDKPIVKPDLSNLTKAIEDAGNGILWHDDSQIVSLMASKEYGGVAGVLIGITQYACG